CKVISVGNITAGGTGKTPLVMYIAKLLKRTKPAILTRGYGRKSRKKLVYANKSSGPGKTGDEPFYMASELKTVPVLVSGDRYYSGRVAVKKFGARIVILDDGFQRRLSLKRDLDIVLLDCLKPFGNDMLLPAGTLREPASALKEADIIVLSKADEGNPSGIRARLKKINSTALVVESIFEPLDLQGLQNPGKKLELKLLHNKKVLALSAIGNPTYFERILYRYKLLELLPVRYRDHHNYERDDLLALNKISGGFDYIITTAKDAVKLKLQNLKELKVPVYVLRIAFKITKGGKEFDERLKTL
ncbi:MAG: tetraacyldisaccharide 4'-kinase, partial [Candidatus Firestonebacteria bacterium]